MEAEKAIDLIIEMEGGLVEHPDDPGGLTNMGITLRSYPDLGREGIINLTREQAVQIYLQDYWFPIMERVSDKKLRLLAFDTAVNSGVSRAMEWLRAYNTFDSFLAARLRFYADLSTFDTFGRGWTRRVAKVVDKAERWYGEESGVKQAELLVDNRSLWDRVLSAFSKSWGPVAYQVRPRSGGPGSKLDVRRDS